MCARLEDPAISLQTARYMLTFTHALVQAYNLSRIFERIKVFCEESFNRVSSATKDKQKFCSCEVEFACVLLGGDFNVLSLGAIVQMLTYTSRSSRHCCRDVTHQTIVYSGL